MQELSPIPWHTLSAEDALGKAGSSTEGLNEKEAAARLLQEGPNALKGSERQSVWSMLLQQIQSVLMLTLFAAALLSFILGHTLEAVAITVIVVFAVLLGFLQEFRAEKAIRALAEMAPPLARVRRGGKELLIPAESVVAGDILILSAGDRVPADGRLLFSAALQLEESSLTGESLPSDKDASAAVALDAPLGDQSTMVFAGTGVSAGRGEAVTVATGMQTRFGGIAELLGGVESLRTPLQDNLDRIGTILARSALLIVALLVIAGFLRGQPFLEMLVFGIALAVAVVPEALPAVVTISLALGVQRMARRNALMRSLPAVETLGSTTVICSDKTGTLTRDEMTVRAVHTSGVRLAVSGTGYDPSGSFSQEGDATIPASLQPLLTASMLCNDAKLEKSDEKGWSVAGDPTEGALLVLGRKGGLDEQELRRQHPRLDELPFSPELRRMLTLHRFEGRQRLFMKGAPETVLDACSEVLLLEGPVSLDDLMRRELLEVADAFAGKAMRVLALAEQWDGEIGRSVSGMTFLGFAAMIDPPRPEAALAVSRCRSAGIRPVLITGDHPATAHAIASELGMAGDGEGVSGRMLEEMDEEALSRAVQSASVFARVSPEHKLRIVEALQRHGEVVAMTGDGVNDAPALKRADIGISMGITGTDVAKEASDMMLTDDNFASIVDAVEEGRGIYENIRKYLSYLLSSNTGELGLMIAATLAGLPLPLTAVQILYVNLATDGLPALALAVDPPESDTMLRPPRKREAGVFSRAMVALLLGGGIWSAVVNVSLFLYALDSGRPLREAMSMTFASLVFIQFFKAYAFRSQTRSMFSRPFTNRWLNLAILWELGLLAVIFAVPVFHEPFALYPLSTEDWLLVALVSLTVVPVLELIKFLVRRRVIYGNS
ncbi:MAG: cation-translocating P-type ATPase [Chlorobium sp.]|nr:cation-translocating P-type ATPase [Chlorobium phaeovibrioides]NQU46533.1 cation-translocating P-type ATPase [Chlorobium sp.]